MVEDAGDPFGVDAASLTPLVRDALGRFNGAYPDGDGTATNPWLSRGWLRGLVAESGAAVTELERLAASGGPPLVRQLFPPPVVAEMRRLWEEREVFLAALDPLPQTLCHHDAFRRNLLSGRGRRERSSPPRLGNRGPRRRWRGTGAAGVGQPIFLRGRGDRPARAGRHLLRQLRRGIAGGGVNGGRAPSAPGPRRRRRAALHLGTLRLGLPLLADSALDLVAAEIFGRPFAVAVAAWAKVWPFQLGWPRRRGPCCP